MSDILTEGPQYQIEIRRLVANPAYVEWMKSPRHAYGESSPDCWLENKVTTATLTPEQWRKVQAAIVESLE